MNRAGVMKAKAEAERFIAACDELLDNGRGYDWTKVNYVAVTGAWAGASDDPKRSGAVRRASMDLTRALAEMRKP